MEHVATVCQQFARRGDQHVGQSSIACEVQRAYAPVPTAARSWSRIWSGLWLDGAMVTHLLVLEPNLPRLRSVDAESVRRNQEK